MLNKVMIIGNLTRDPELRYTPNGKTTCAFSVAVNRKYKDSNGNLKEAATFYRVVTWNKIAENVNSFLSKGSKVYVEGRGENRSWEKNGEKHQTFEIIAQTVQFLNTKKKEETYEDGIIHDHQLGD